MTYDSQSTTSLILSPPSSSALDYQQLPSPTTTSTATHHPTLKKHSPLTINTNNHPINRMFSLQTPPNSNPPNPTTPTSITPTTHFTTNLHQKSYSAYQFPTVNFNSPTPPTTDRTSYFDLPTQKKLIRPLHQKAQSESLMSLELPSHHFPSNASFDNIPMLRKKSGELVRSSLKLTASSSICSSSSRSNSYSNSRSAPSTPTQGPKAVHFDAHLEHVRHFLSQQRPIAVSRDGSPIETETEGEEEYPFPDMQTRSIPDRSTKLVIELPNMPLNPRLDGSNKLCLQSIELAPDAKNLKGTILVENLSFEKRVAVRFTFDRWQTVSEVTADYLRSQPCSSKLSTANSLLASLSVDIFVFTIKLQDVLARIDERQMEIAVRYLAAGGEYWDNNRDANYHVRFKTLRNGPSSSSHHHHQQQQQHQQSSISNPTRSFTTGPDPTTSTTSQTEPCPWAVTLRAELDRLVGDDLGISMGMNEGIVKKKKHHSASFSLGSSSSSSSSPARLDALAAGNQLRAGSGLSARYDFGLSLKQAAAHKPSTRFQPVFPLPNRAPVPVEWIGISQNHSSQPAVGGGFLDSLTSSNNNTTSSNPIGQQHNPKLNRRWSSSQSTTIIPPKLPPSPPQEEVSSTISPPSSIIIHRSLPNDLLNLSVDHHQPPVNHLHQQPQQPSFVSFMSGLVTPQSPSLSDAST